MKRKFGRILALAAVAAAAGTALITGTAFAGGNVDDSSGGGGGGSSHHSRVSDRHNSCDDDCDSNSRCNNECHDSGYSDDCDCYGDTHVKGDYYEHYRGARAHEGGVGGDGGSNSAKCLVPVGLSAGAVASSGGEVSQCNAAGADGGGGGNGDQKGAYSNGR